MKTLLAVRRVCQCLKLSAPQNLSELVSMSTLTSLIFSLERWRIWLDIIWEWDMMTTVREISFFMFNSTSLVLNMHFFHYRHMLRLNQAMNVFVEIGMDVSCHNRLSDLRMSSHTSSQSVVVPIILTLFESDKACVFLTNPMKWVNLIPLKESKNDKLFLIVCFFLLIDFPRHFIAWDSKKLWKWNRGGGRRMWLWWIERMSQQW